MIILIIYEKGNYDYFNNIWEETMIILIIYKRGNYDYFNNI